MGFSTSRPVSLLRISTNRGVASSTTTSMNPAACEQPAVLLGLDDVVAGRFDVFLEFGRPRRLAASVVGDHQPAAGGRERHRAARTGGPCRGCA